MPDRVLTAEEVAAKVADLRAEARSLRNEGHTLRADLVDEAADALARSHELLRRRGWACDYHHPEFVAGCTGCVKREARAEKAPA